MKRERRSFIYQWLVILVPCLTLISPSWLSIGGIGPRWEQFWLLPFALKKGPLNGLFAGFCLGLILDGLNLGGSTQIPALMIIGYWWGLLGRKRQYANSIFQLGLFAWVGAFFSGMCIWFQQIFLIKEGIFFVFNSWAFHTLFSASILNALLAPIICSLALRFFYGAKN